MAVNTPRPPHAGPEVRMPNGTSGRSKPLRKGEDIPLSVLAQIVSYVNDVGDLSRLTRTHRVLYYMATPKLYEKVSLRSRSQIKYYNGRPQGFGGGSPFTAALSGLLSHDYVGCVKNFELCGDYRESDGEDYTRGRVPDGTMMLNTTLRACIDRMDRLEEFSWRLNVKPMKFLYQSLTLRSTLTRLTICCPATRTPRPTTIIPPMPSIRKFEALDIDPLCYPDDISWLLAHSRNLEHVKLKWSPRMRLEGELSTNLHSVFGRAMQTKTMIRWKEVELFNLFAAVLPEVEQIMDSTSMESFSFLLCSKEGGDILPSSNPITAFVDAGWETHEPTTKKPPTAKAFRTNILDYKTPRAMSHYSGLERFYIVTGYRVASQGSQTSSSKSTPGTTAPGFTKESASQTPNSTVPSPETSMNSPSAQSMSNNMNGQRSDLLSLASEYIAVLTQHHGQSLRHLLLSPRWSLNAEVLNGIADACPNLEQLGVAFTEFDDNTSLPVLRKLPHLYALRVLVDRTDSMWDSVVSAEPEKHAFAMTIKLANEAFRNIRWFGVGPLPFKVGPLKRKLHQDGFRLREVHHVSWEEASQCEIFGMDNLDS